MFGHVFDADFSLAQKCVHLESLVQLAREEVCELKATRVRERVRFNSLLEAEQGRVRRLLGQCNRDREYYERVLEDERQRAKQRAHRQQDLVALRRLQADSVLEARHADERAHLEGLLELERQKTREQEALLELERQKTRKLAAANSRLRAASPDLSSALAALEQITASTEATQRRLCERVTELQGENRLLEQWLQCFRTGMYQELQRQHDKRLTAVRQQLEAQHATETAAAVRRISELEGLVASMSVQMHSLSQRTYKGLKELRTSAIRLQREADARHEAQNAKLCRMVAALEGDVASVSVKVQVVTERACERLDALLAPVARLLHDKHMLHTCVQLLRAQRAGLEERARVAEERARVAEREAADAVLENSRNLGDILECFLPNGSE